MLIEVTQADIDNGKPGKNALCPVALALKRAANTREVNVMYTLADVDDVCYWLPENAKTFVEQFDAEKPVEPFTFELLPESLSLIF